MKTNYKEELDCLKEMWGIDDEVRVAKIVCQAHYIMRGYRPQQIKLWSNSFKTEADIEHVFNCVMDELFNPPPREHVIDILSLKPW